MIDYDRNIAEAERYYLAASAFSIFVYASNTLFHTVPINFLRSTGSAEANTQHSC